MISKTLEKALKIIENDISKIEQLGQDAAPLERSEATKLTEYVKVLITASRNERDQAKADGLSDISDEELEKLAAEALKEIKGE